MDAPEATTMSVCDMGKLLGLGKTESYYLVHKSVFDTVVVAGKLRVVKSSFEQWYENQDRYTKIDGALPGIRMHEQLYSIRDIAELLSLSDDSARELIHREKLLTISIGGKFRVPKVVFDDWYLSQNRYRNTSDRERDQSAVVSSVTVPDMGRIMGIDRREAWKLYGKGKHDLELIRIADKPRITLESFYRWYTGQAKYRLLPTVDLPEDHAMNELIPVKEAACRLQIDIQRIYRLLNGKKLKGKRIGSTWYVRFYETLYNVFEEGQYGEHC